MESKTIMLVLLGLVGGFILLQVGSEGLNDLSRTTGDTLREAGTGRLAGSGARPADRAEGSPSSYVKHYASIDRALGPIMATQGDPVFLGDVFADWRVSSAKEVLGAPLFIEERSDCRVTPPAPGARVYNIALDEPTQDIGLFAYARADLILATSTWIDRVQGAEAPSERILSPKPEIFGFEVVDIAVTETEAPVHLVLQSVAGERPMALSALNTIANIHLAPGAHISGVTLLGGDAMAVANLPDGTPVEAISRDTMLECGLENRALRRLRYEVNKETRDSMTLTDEEIAALHNRADAKARAFNDWFEVQFGTRSVETRFGYESGRGALAGPVPGNEAARLAFSPLAGADFQVFSPGPLMRHGHDNWEDEFRAAILALAADMAGGDIALLSAAPLLVREEN